MIKMKKSILFIFTIVLSMTSCSDYLDVNDNPNDPTEVPAELLLKGMLLSDAQVNCGHILRISQMWTGQLKGVQNLYGRLYGYAISPEESNDVWAYAYALKKQNQIIQASSEDNLYKGIANVVEAHALGSMASLYGDVPFSEAGSDETPNAQFDSQASVFTAVQALCDQAISQLSGVPTTRKASDDLFLNGKATAWIQVANTLKARYFLQLKDYPSALAAARTGISTDANSLKYVPIGDNTENRNLYYIIQSGSRAGDLTSVGSFIQEFLAGSRNNAKTNELSRAAYLSVDQNNLTAGTIAGQAAKMPMVTYAENQLIIAECSARGGDLDAALVALNALRAWLNGGTAFPNSGAGLSYQAYELADFASGGIENTDGIAQNRALLREIIEERYVSGFGTYIPFNDSRRLRKSDSDIAINIPLNSPTITTYPERMPIGQNEINSNSSAPNPIPSIFDKTPVNQ